MKKKVMQRAWELAKQGVKQFGGKAREYFAVSLRMAWAEIKEESTMGKEVFANLPELSAVSDKQKKYAEDIRTAYLEKVKQALEEVQPTAATCKREMNKFNIMSGFWNSKFYGLFTEFCKVLGDHNADQTVFNFETFYNHQEAVKALCDFGKKYESIDEYNVYCKEVTEKAVSLTLETFEKCVSVSTKAKAWINGLKHVLYK